MILVVPFGADTSVYYWPYTTLGLIVVNIAVFCATLTNPGLAVPWLLMFGDGIHPLQWITSAFLHADIWHIAGNMVFLWSFGIIVEGKLGWYKMLALYLGIAAAQSAIVQFLMLGSQGCALGASGAIFGLMAISLVWAPESRIRCYFVFLYWIFRYSEFEVRVVAMVLIYVTLEFLTAMLTGMAMSTEVLHLLGAAVGLPVGLALLKLGWVDCDHWDFFSVWAGRHTMTDKERYEADEKQPARAQQRAKEEEERRAASLQQIREILQNGQPQFALKAHQRMAREFPDWTLPEADLLSLIHALQEQKLWSQSIEPMVEYLKHYSQKAPLVRLKLAQILIVQEKRPVQALKVIAHIDRAALDPRHREFLGKLEAQARQLHEQAPYEVAGEAW